MKKPKRFYAEEFEFKEDRRRAPVITEEIQEIRKRAPILEDMDSEELEYNLKMKKGGVMKKSKMKPSMSDMGLEDENLKPGKEYMMAKGGAAKPTKAQKKIGTVMREFKAGKLHSGKKGPVVKSSKQAIAIALSEAGKSKKKMMGGMMSDGVSKKGMGVEKRMGGGMMSDGVANKGSGIEMKSKGGMVRGQGIAIRGTKFKGVF